jgi:hypothetical protein
LKSAASVRIAAMFEATLTPEARSGTSWRHGDRND